MPTGFGVAKQINEIVKKHDLALIEILRIGPRFFIGLYRRNGKKALLKISLGHTKENDDFRRVCRKLNRESRFLDILSHYRDPFLKKTVLKLIDFETKNRAWYLREYIEATPQNFNKSNFLFRKSFFNDRASTFLAQFFASLHGASKDFPSSFKKTLKRYPLENQQEGARCFEILENRGLSHLKEKVKKFLDAKREIFDKNQNVITHYEAYAPHILKDIDSNFYFIDWENVDWGNIARDIATLWIRAFEHPTWQKDLIEKFLKFSSPEQKKYFKDLFGVEVILRSVFKIDYLGWTQDKDELRMKDQVIEFLKANIEKALEEKLL